jgi:putative oxidoreductase
MDTGKTLDAASPTVLSMFRVVVSLLFVCHGAATILGTFGGPPGGKPSVGTWPGWWAGLIQLVGGILVLLGVGEMGTRIAAMICSGSMAYAYFSVHQKHALWPIQNGGEASIMFCWSFLLIMILGPGTLTLTWALRKLTASSKAPSGPTLSVADAPSPTRATESV